MYLGNIVLTDRPSVETGTVFGIFTRFLRVTRMKMDKVAPGVINARLS